MHKALDPDTTQQEAPQLKHLGPPVLTRAAPISSRCAVLKCCCAYRPTAEPQKDASSVNALTSPSSLKPTTLPVPALDFCT